MHIQMYTQKQRPTLTARLGYLEKSAVSHCSSSQFPIIEKLSRPLAKPISQSAGGISSAKVPNPQKTWLCRSLLRRRRPKTPKSLALCTSRKFQTQSPWFEMGASGEMDRCSSLFPIFGSFQSPSIAVFSKAFKNIIYLKVLGPRSLPREP